MALFGLYSPFVVVSSYFPIVSAISRADQRKLALRLFVCVSVFSLAALWIGEPLLELLGLSTASLITTGGIALMFTAIPIMVGKSELPSSQTPAAPVYWKAALFMPVTFPLTLNGTTFAVFVSYRAEASGHAEMIALSAVGIAFATLTSLTLYASGFLERRVSLKARFFLERVTGILLTATAVSLLASGISRIVVDLHRRFLP